MANLVFIHGAGEDRRIWDRQVVAFGGRHAVIAVDLPGRGQRAADPPNDWHEKNAEDVLGQMEKAGMQRAVLIGHSMGGGIALTAALGSPGRGAGLVLVATGARLRMHPDFIEQARRRAEGLAGTGESPIPLETTVGSSVSPETLAWIGARTMVAPPRTIYADFVATNRFDVMARLGEISAPTLIVGGAEDRMTPPKYSEFMAGKIAGARLVILAGSGHYPQVEREEEFNQALARFLDEHAPAA